MKEKIALVCALSVFFSGCSAKKEYSTLSLSEYGIENTDITVYQITYEEFSEMNEKKELDGAVLILREDCEYCHIMLSDLTEGLKGKDRKRSLYALESNGLSTEEKTELVDEYDVAGVPTILIYENGKLNAVDIGGLSEDQMKELIGHLT